MASNPIVLVFRQVVLSRLEAIFQRGDRAIVLGPGGDEEALVLGSRGVRVIEVDPSTATRAPATGCDGAYATFGALDHVDLRALASSLSAALRPGAALLLTFAGPSPLPASVRRTLTGLGEPRRRRRLRGDGAAGPPTFVEAQRALGAAFVWTDVYALGVLLPGPEHERWAADHPQGFGLLAALERAVRRGRGLRGRGEYVVLEGRRAGA